MTTTPLGSEFEDHIYNSTEEHLYASLPDLKPALQVETSGGETEGSWYSSSAGSTSLPIENISGSTSLPIENKVGSTSLSTENKPSIISDEELKSLTADALSTQTFVLMQLGMLKQSLAEKTVQNEGLTAQLASKNDELLASSELVKELREKNQALILQLEAEKEERRKVEKELSEAQCRAEEGEATIEYLETIAEQYKEDAKEMRQGIRETEDQLTDLKACTEEMEKLISRIEVIRYEVDDSERSLDNFVEDIVTENCTLRQQVKEAERTIITTECKIMDLEMCCEGLRETLRDIQMSYADQSGDCKELEKALETMHRLYKDADEELKNVKGEIAVYETNTGDLLTDLKRTQSQVEETETHRRQSEALTLSVQARLDKSEAMVGQLQREKEQAERVIELKEDVISSLHESIQQVVEKCMGKLAMIGVEEAPERSTVKDQQCGDADTLLALKQRFFDVVDELERKEDILVHLMSENVANDTDTVAELEEQIREQKEKLKKSATDLMKLEDSVEEKELIIGHLVNVINRYAYSDRESEDSDKATLTRKKRTSDPGHIGPTIPGAVCKRQSSDRESQRRNKRNS